MKNKILIMLLILLLLGVVVSTQFFDKNNFESDIKYDAEIKVAENYEVVESNITFEKLLDNLKNLNSYKLVSKYTSETLDLESTFEIDNKNKIYSRSNNFNKHPRPSEFYVINSYANADKFVTILVNGQVIEGYEGYEFSDMVDINRLQKDLISYTDQQKYSFEKRFEKYNDGQIAMVYKYQDGQSMKLYFNDSGLVNKIEYPKFDLHTVVIELSEFDQVEVDTKEYLKK